MLFCDPIGELFDVQDSGHGRLLTDVFDGPDDYRFVTILLEICGVDRFSAVSRIDALIRISSQIFHLMPYTHELPEGDVSLTMIDTSIQRLCPGTYVHYSEYPTIAFASPSCAISSGVDNPRDIFYWSRITSNQARSSRDAEMVQFIKGHDYDAWKCNQPVGMINLSYRGVLQTHGRVVALLILSKSYNVLIPFARARIEDIYDGKDDDGEAVSFFQLFDLKNPYVKEGFTEIIPQNRISDMIIDGQDFVDGFEELQVMDGGRIKKTWHIEF